MDDWKLLLEWTERGSDEAFRSLVERHSNLVYSVARRSVPTPSQAEEVTQTVFIILARKAAGLSRRTVLAGWLYRTTRFTALEMLRTENRQQSRREEFSRMETAAPNRLWEQVAPVLEEALDRIHERDRNALVLRFLEERSLREVGQTLGISEEAARKRVERGLEKLRALLARRGIASSAALLSVMLTTSAVHAAPAGLASSVTTGATASVTATSSSTLLKGTLLVMAWTKAKAIALVVVAVFLCSATTYVAVRKIADGARTAPELGRFGFALRRDSEARASFAGIRPGSAAERAGLSNGFVLRSINGVAIAEMGLRECIGRMYGPAGSVLRLEVIDPQRDVTNTVELTRGRALSDIGGIGVALDRDKKTRAPSVVVVFPGSAAERAGFSKGLIIHAIDGVPTAGLEIRECERQLQGPPGSPVRLEVINLERNATNTVELTRVRL